MNWTDLAGAELLRRVFTYPLPMEKVDAMSIHLDRDGPAIRIEFDLINQLPDAPVPKWVSAKFNRCRLGLNCSGIEELVISGWETKNVVEVEIRRISSQKNLVRLSNEQVHIVFTCTDLVVTGPSVYWDAST